MNARIAGLYAITPDLADTGDLLYRVRAALAGGAGRPLWQEPERTPSD